MKYELQSNVYVPTSIEVHGDLPFGISGSQLEAYRCAECYALVAKDDQYWHEIWHRDLADGVGGKS